jgi:hypothetical protein
MRLGTLQHVRRPRLIAALLIIAAIFGVCAVQGTYIAPLDHYRRTEDPRVITVVVMTGAGDRILTRSASEDASSVTVAVRVWASPGLKPAIAVPHLVTLTLAAPLEARSVVDPSGGSPRSDRPPRPISEVICPSTRDVRCQWN